MKLYRIIVAVLFICLLAGMLPVFGSADDIPLYYIDKVLIQTYPGSGGNDLPYVSQQYSAFYAQTTTSGVSVTGWSLTDSSGNACSGKVENKDYTLSVNVSSGVVNSLFSSETKAYINNEAANISVLSDGMSASITRSIRPKLVGATVWKDPGDESHESGNTFSYVASASPYYDSIQWYVRSPYNESYKVEEIGKVFPGVTANVIDHGANGTTCNLIAVPPQMDKWTVYCAFVGVAGQTNTKDAYINVTDAAVKLQTPEPTPQIIQTPAPTVFAVDPPTPAPAPTPEVYIVTEDWSDEWSYDKDSHWHESRIPQVTDINEQAPHDMVWTETRAATKKADGEEQGKCSVCGYTETRSVIYTKPERTSLALPSAVKWIIGAVGGIIVLAAIVVFIEYLKVKARKKRRARMSGRNNGGRSHRNY